MLLCCYALLRCCAFAVLLICSASLLCCAVGHVVHTGLFHDFPDTVGPSVAGEVVECKTS